MDQAGGVEQDPDQRELPEPGVEIDTGRQCLQRNVAERMVEKVAGQISKLKKVSPTPNRGSSLSVVKASVCDKKK